MSTAEGLGGRSSPEAVALGETVTFFGAVADYAAGAAPDEGERIASVAVGIGRVAGLSKEELDALYFAARLRNAGALGNLAFAKGEELPDRAQLMQRWDIPPVGARICERISALPTATADIVRWQAEAWDGTGYPDQLRWSGIPHLAQMLNIAATFAAMPDPDEGLSLITSEAGRAFAPEQTRTFVQWFHLFGGEFEPAARPFGVLDAASTKPMQIVEMLSERVDAHNGTPLRAQRIARYTSELGQGLSLDGDEMRRVEIAALLFGIGELRADHLESQAYDPLSRLGIETRAGHAAIAAGLAEQYGFVADVAPALRSRAEWYDGTGKPRGLRHDAIPKAGQLLATAIAYDALDEGYRSRITEERVLPISRLETVAGTQFDPMVVRVLAEVIRAHA